MRRSRWSGSKVIMSPLCKRAFKRDGLTVQVHIYRLEHGDKWTLEVVDRDSNSIVWDGEFDTDADAYKEFLRAVKTEGIDGILRNPDRLH
jgi:hypothetical protein